MPAKDDVVGFREKHSLVWLVAVGVVCSALTWAVTRWSAPSPQTPTVKRFSVVLPPGERLAKPGIQRSRAVAISPSGSHIVYATDEELYIRAMDNTEGAPLAGTNALLPASPFFSPDGQWVGFYSRRDRELKKIALLGGVAVSIAAADPIMGATWGADDMILFGQGPEGIMQVSASGGVAELVMPVNGAEDEQARMPQFLPGGQAVLFTLATGAGGLPWLNAQIVVQKLGDSTRRVLVEHGLDARYLPTGHLVYEREQGLVAVPFDVGRLAVTGEPVPVVERVNRPNFALEGLDDQQVLAHAADAGRLLVSHDRRTMPHHFADFVINNASPDVLIVSQKTTTVVARGDLADLDRVGSRRMGEQNRRCSALIDIILSA